MLPDALIAALDDAWQPARAAGVLGSASVTELVEHTAGFASAVCSAFSAESAAFDGSIIDVGTGAGVPGVLLACLLPAATVTLVDASERRLDHVRRAARAADVADRLTVLHARADALGHDPRHRGTYDAAVARLLGPPAESLELLLPLVRNAGLVVASTAEDQGPMWRQLPLERLPTSSADLGTTPGFVAVRCLGPIPPVLPRRPNVRARSPLF